jgi:hypothetical protein
MKLDFGNVLTRAWQITWKHKILWIFGIFAGCSRSGGSFGGGNSGGSRWEADSDLSVGAERFAQQVAQWIEQNWWIIVLAVLVLIVLILLGIYLGTIGRIALIRGTMRAEAGVDRMGFGELFAASGPYFWRVFGLSLIIGLAALAIFLPLALFGVLTAGVGFLCMLPLICVLIPVGWAVSVVLEQANVAIVTEDLGIMDGVRRGWEVCKANLGGVVVMALILWFLQLMAGFIIAIPILLAVVPAIFGLAAGQQDITSAPYILAGLCIVAYLPILIVLSGIITTYVQSAWALTYMRLALPKDKAPVLIDTNA